MIAQFALRLACGMGLMWLVMPRREVTAGFFKIQMRVVLGLGVLAALTIGGAFASGTPAVAVFSATTARVLCGVVALLAWLGSVFWLYDQRRAGTRVMVPLTGLAGTLLFVGYGMPSANQAHLNWLLPFSEIASAGLLGSCVTGMLLGHWYLTSPTMTIKPLSFLNHCLLGTALLRLAVCTIALVLAWPSITSTTQWVWLSLRWLAGLAGPLLVWWLVWRILRYKNTQSATGVLFSGVIVTFIGEMTASLLFTELPYPV